MPCTICSDEYEGIDLIDGKCRWCRKKELFAQFAKSCGLKWYPDPTGERYLYSCNGGCVLKKSEHVSYMEELWNALVKASGGSDDLMLGKE